ncbi:MAG: ABC transporter ATP-binding protein [Ethanoligenens sp.]
MIAIEQVTKTFETFAAVKKLSCTIDAGSVYGLVGSNGAGKSTLLRLITGIYRPDSGCITLDGAPVYENPEAKCRMAFVPDDLYFLPQANMERMALLYASIYERFSDKRFRKLAKAFRLDTKKKIGSFSKGMRRQAATILALAAQPDYLFFDETFDGLDPIMRELVKKVIYSDICERNATAVITSHSLRELEDTCDQLALLHQGGLVFEQDVEHLKTALFKVQIAFSDSFDRNRFADIILRHYEQNGRVANMIVADDREKTIEKLKAMNPTLLDVLSLSLEEVCLYEMDALGYSLQGVLDNEGEDI